MFEESESCMFDIWSFHSTSNKTKNNSKTDKTEDDAEVSSNISKQDTTESKQDEPSPNAGLVLKERFGKLQNEWAKCRQQNERKNLNREKRRTKSLVKKAMKDINVKHLVENKDEIVNSSESEGDDGEEKVTTKWKDVKPYIKKEVASGSSRILGPKCEVETMIDQCLKEGDFEKAETLSDTLADKKFAKQIADAFATKRFAEKRQQEENLKKEKRLKQIRWGFEPKEKWQMKGNM